MLVVLVAAIYKEGKRILGSPPPLLPFLPMSTSVLRVSRSRLALALSVAGSVLGEVSSSLSTTSLFLITRFRSPFLFL